MQHVRLAVSLAAAAALCLAVPSAPSAEVRLPGLWYDTDKTNNGQQHKTDELWGMYWNYYDDLDADGEYDFGEPWVEEFGPDADNDWQKDPLEKWGSWIVGRDESCWAAAANNMTRYAGAGNPYIGWVYDGTWADGWDRTWEDSGRAAGALEADYFPTERQDASNGVWAFDAPGWVSARLASGLPVAMGAFWHDDSTGPPNPTGGHAFSVYAIDTVAQTITLADNSRDFEYAPNEQEDYSTFDYTFDPATDYFILPDYRDKGNETCHVSSLDTFAVTSWQGNGVNGANPVNWQTPINWQGNIVPAATGQQQFAYIEFTEPGLVFIGSAAEARMLIVRDSRTTIEINPAGSLTLGNLNFADGQLTIRGQADVYRADVTSGTVIVDAGTFNAVRDGASDYGNVTCAGTITVRDGGTMDAANNLETHPSAVLTVEDPSSAVHVGYDFDANGDVNVRAAASLDVGNTLRAGAGADSGTADIDVTQAAVKVGNQMLLGADRPADVTCTESALDVGSLLSVGETDTGTLSLYAGRTEAMYLYIGHQADTDGHLALHPNGRLVGPQVKMRGTDTLDPMVVVGDDGTGSVTHTAGSLGPLDADRDKLTVMLGNGKTGLGEYLFTHGEISTYDMVVGQDGKGTVTQRGGLVTVDNWLSVAARADSEGTYLMNEGTVRADRLRLGVADDGTFTQDSGLVEVADRLEFAATSTGNGLYTLNGGTLKVNQISTGAGTGKLIIDGGTVDLTGPSIDVDFLEIGSAVGSVGQLDLAGKGLTAVQMSLGVDGQGTYNMTGGTTNVTSVLFIGLANATGAMNQTGGTTTLNIINVGASAGGLGSYNLNAGTLQVDDTLYVAFQGEGSFRQTGGSTVTADSMIVGYASSAPDNHYRQDSGSLDVTTELTLGRSAGSQGRFELLDGAAATGQTTVGDAGAGTFAQSGGQHHVAGDLVLGNTLGGHGTYEFGNGVLTMGGDLWIGKDGGTGTFDIAGPKIQGAGGTLHITGSASALRGWGRVDMPVEHDDGTINAHSGVLALKQGCTGPGDVTVDATGELGIEADSALSGNIANSGHIRVRKGTTELTGQMAGSAVGRVTVDAGARLDVSCEIDEIHTLSVAGGGRVAHLSDQSEVVSAVELRGVYHLDPTAVLISARTEVDGRFHHNGGEHDSGEVWIGALAGPALYAIDGGSFKVADLHVGRSFADGAAPGLLRINDPGADVTVSNLLVIHQAGSVQAVPGATIHMTGSAFENLSTEASAVSGLSRVELVFTGGPATVDPVEVAGADRGAAPGGFDANFTFGALTLGGGTSATAGRVQLVDACDNQPTSTTDEALYVKELTVGADSYIDLAGLNLYCMTADIDAGATVTGGTITPVAMAKAGGVPQGMQVSVDYDPSGSYGMGTGSLAGVCLLGGTASMDAAEVDDAVAASPEGFITLTMYYLEDELDYLGIPEDTVRPYWWDGADWILGGTTTAGAEGAGVFAGVNVDPGDYGAGYFGLNTAENSLWNHVTHASTYGAVGVPEPATLLLLAAGAMVMTVRRKRRPGKLT